MLWVFTASWSARLSFRTRWMDNHLTEPSLACGHLSAAVSLMTVKNPIRIQEVTDNLQRMSKILNTLEIILKESRISVGIPPVYNSEKSLKQH